MEYQMTDQQFRDLYHRMVEWTPPPQDRKSVTWGKISSILWEDSTVTCQDERQEM